MRHARLRRIRMLGAIITRTHVDKLLYGYIFTILLFGFIMQRVEPGIETYGDSLWYCYTMGTTIGFGDLVAVTTVGRLLSVILSVYTILLIGMIPGIVVSYYMQIIKTVENESVTEFFDQLEHLPELSKAELQALSDRIKVMDKRCLRD